MMTGLSGIISELNSTGAPLSALFLSFIVFSFIGWLYESTICALANYGHFANSGFLLGPCCPIYGVGSLACWFLLRDIPNVAVQFAAAALVCSAIEYGVGAALEQITGARFWDYSSSPSTSTAGSAYMAPRSLERGRCSFAVSPSPPC